MTARDTVARLPEITELPERVVQDRGDDAEQRQHERGEAIVPAEHDAERRTPSTMIAAASNGAPVQRGRNEESACAIASFQNTILSSALSGNSTTRQTRMAIGMK